MDNLIPSTREREITKGNTSHPADWTHTGSSLDTGEMIDIAETMTQVQPITGETLRSVIRIGHIDILKDPREHMPIHMGTGYMNR